MSEEMLRRALDAAYDLHRHREPESFPGWLARVLAHAVPCDSALLVTVNIGRRDFEITSWPANAFERLDRERAFELHALDHPFVARCASSRAARAFRLAELSPHEQFSRTELYRSLYRFLGIEHQLLMLIASPGAQWRAVALNRGKDEFSEEDRLVLELLWPHVMLASRSLGRGAPRRGAAMLELPAGGHRGIVVIRSDGTVTLCSEQARLWFADYFDARFFARGVTLPPRVADWVRQRLEADGKGRRLRASRREPLAIARGDRCLLLDMVVDHGKALHLMTLDEEALNASPRLLEGMGLTPREAEVLAWVAQGKTNQVVGLILGTSARTVQKHLEHIFQKLGVESRTAAILRAWQHGRYTTLAPQTPTRPSSRC